MSNLFGVTLREAPADVEVESHRLLLRAGYVRQLAQGIFSYLPLAWRSIAKLERILREEIERIGGQELSMPVVHPGELWRASGRWSAIDDTMVRFEDRRGRELLLAMTHEEVVAQLAASEIISYRQLPVLLFQIQTKFRDELRARGGLIRVREFLMKDSYSLDADQDGLERQYEAHYEAYGRIGRRVGLSLRPVASDVGMMGGQVAHEFIYLTPIGEDTLALCDSCGYSANGDVARFSTPDASGEESEVERVHTPGASTIAGLCDQLGIEAAETGKMVFYTARYADRPDRLIVALVRGDLDVNEIRVQAAVGAVELRAAEEEEIGAAGMTPGYASPIGAKRDGLVVVVDPSVAQAPALVLGANETDFHLRATRCGRDYEPDLVSPIASVYEGAPCAECGAPLSLQRGIEVGNIFQLGARYAEALGAEFAAEDGSRRPVVMGSYGIGVGRLLACVAEEHRDERGLDLPASVAPFDVTLVSLTRGGAARQEAEKTFEALLEAGLDVLYDDREDASPGVKLTDADLRGVPLRVVVSERSLEAGGAETARRAVRGAPVIPLAEVPAWAVGRRDAAIAELSGAS